MAALEDNEQNTWDDYDAFYADDENVEECITVSVRSTKKSRSTKTKKHLEKEYQAELEKMRNAKVDLDYTSCAISFYLLGDYKDSKGLHDQSARRPQITSACPFVFNTLFA